ncbi:MAG: fructose-bisphosphatase class II [Acidobacteriota bacterium]
MNDSRTPGRRTNARVRIHPSRLDSRRIFSREARRLSTEETRSWNERNRPLLDRYQLDIAAISVLPLPVDSPAAGGKGPLQSEHRDRLLLTSALAALAVSVAGRGDLLAVDPERRGDFKIRIKENNDRNSTAAMTEALYALCEASPDVRIRIAIGEGARTKPGERGGNPTLYGGQVIGAASHDTGVTEYSVAVDTVEGTTKSAVFEPSCGTLLYVTSSPIAAVPDVYFDKCQLRGIDGITVADPLERIVEAARDYHHTSDLNFFALDRPRHPIDRMLALGANMRLDDACDAYPAVASGLFWGVFPDNLRPLDGVCANIGGAAEMIASAAGAYYLGVRSTARFCASRIPAWEKRYDFGPGEEEHIRAKGFDPARVYRIEDLVPDIEHADGAFLASAIADNWHIPGLEAVYVGGNFATVDTLFVGSAGTADLYRITFTYRRPLEETAAGMTPVLTRILSLAPDEIPGAVRAAVADPDRSRRLRHEVATSFYMHLGEPETPQEEDRRMRLDLESAGRAESPETMLFLREITSAAPDWFKPL